MIDTARFTENFPLRRKCLKSLVVMGMVLPGSSFNKVYAFSRNLFSWSAPEYDVIVVGAGAAGLAAAIEAADKDLKVVVLEKAPEIGGNTLISGGFYSSVDPERQKQQGIEDSEEFFFQQTYEGGGKQADEVLVRHLVHQAQDGLQWLEKLGLHFKDEVFELYGAHWTRSHTPVLPLGQGYIRTLSGAALQRGVQIQTNHSVIELLRERDRVNGVIAVCEGKKKKFYATKGVILTSGSFAANRELIRKFSPKLSALTTNNTPYSTGEPMIAAEKIGAELTGMEFIQCLPGCPPGKKYRVRFHNDVSTFIFLDHDGRRFIREDAPRDELRDAVLKQNGSYAFTLMDGAGFKKAGILVQKEAVLALEAGEAWRANSIEELAKKIGMQPEVLKQTVNKYNEGVREKKDIFGKKITLQTLELKEPPFWAAYAGMTIHYTEGGLKINAKAQVLDKKGVPIKGLYAAGAVTGGIHGKNRLGGNGLADAIVFGRTAGQNIANE